MCLCVVYYVCMCVWVSTGVCPCVCVWYVRAYMCMCVCCVCVHMCVFLCACVCSPIHRDAKANAMRCLRDFVLSEQHMHDEAFVGNAAVELLGCMMLQTGLNSADMQ